MRFSSQNDGVPDAGFNSKKNSGSGSNAIRTVTTTTREIQGKRPLPQGRRNTPPKRGERAHERDREKRKQARSDCKNKEKTSPAEGAQREVAEIAVHADRVYPPALGGATFRHLKKKKVQAPNKPKVHHCPCVLAIHRHNATCKKN